MKLSLLATLFVAQMASAAGLNQENYYPAVDNSSSIMWETPRTIPARAFQFGYTFDYALRPVEFGDGKINREPINDHLQVNHFHVGYGITSWLDVGATVPLSLYSAPTNQGYLKSVGSDRSTFFFVDPKLRVKANAFPGKLGDGFYMAAIGSFWAPVGNAEALLSDNTLRGALEVPLQFNSLGERLELYFTPGVGFWGDENRVVAENPSTLREEVLLKKSQSLLLSLGSRLWIAKGKTNALQIEGGIRGDFSNFSPGFNNTASPIEWQAGALYKVDPQWSFHGAYGTGISSGVGGPLSRLVAGVRYEQEPPYPSSTPKNQELRESSESYSEAELDRILDQAQQEYIPQRNYGDDDSQLRLLKNNQVIDIGAVRFEFNSAKLTPEAHATVRILYDQLRRMGYNSIKVDGHTDSVGSYKYNLALSKRRADSVKAELGRLGMNKNVIGTEGFSFKHPIASNGNSTGRAQNRRIEVAVDGESFRKATYTQEESELYHQWIYPNGKQPKANQNDY